MLYISVYNSLWTWDFPFQFNNKHSAYLVPPNSPFQLTSRHFVNKEIGNKFISIDIFELCVSLNTTGM